MDEQDLYKNLNDDEKLALEQILKEMKVGSSETYEALLYSQYDEIPVTLDEFIDNPEYLGASTDNGKSLYPYWRNALHKIVEGGKNYTEIIFAGCVEGSTRIPLVDGSNPTILEMYDNWNSKTKPKYYTYTYDIKNQQIVKGEVENVFCAGIVPVYEIEFDDCSKTKVSWDHMFMLRDGSYVCAKDLKENDSIMPFNRCNEMLKTPQLDGTYIEQHIEKIPSNVRRYSKNYVNEKIRSLLSKCNIVIKKYGKVSDDLLTKEFPETYSKKKPNAYKYVEKYFNGDIERFYSTAYNFNHKVKSVTLLDEQIPVYDLTIKDYHNFAMIPANNGNKDSAIFCHNAIGLGKSWNACIICAYLLYKLLCLKSPQTYYNLAPKEPISFAFLNIYKYVSESVAYGKFQSMLKASPWFLRHGHIEGRTHPEYKPDKNITFIVGCNPDHIIGQNVYCCLTGDTEVLTEIGYITIKDLLNKKVRIYTQNDDGSIVLTEDRYNSILTKRATELVEIILENNSVIRCTPDHKIRLSNGSYKEAGDLNLDDNIMNGSIKLINKQGVKINSIKIVDADEDVYDIVNVKDTHNFVIKAGDTDIVVHNCLLDEISFNKASAATDLKKKIMDLYSQVRSRMVSRFSKEGILQAKAFLISSKRSDSDFLDVYAQTRVNEPDTFIVDEAQWIVKPAGTFSKETFRVAVGSKSKTSMILQDDDRTTDDELIQKGYSRVIHPPVSLRPDFERDMDNALRDLAGISTTFFMKFLPLDKIRACYSVQLRNPFDNAEPIVGLKDTSQVWDYFNVNMVPDWIKSLPMYIHNDIALSGDGYGLGCVACAGLKTKWNERVGKLTTDPVYIEVFACRIKALKGDQVSIEKVRNFIYWLKFEQGFNIQRVTADSFQSADMLQNMQTRGIPSKMISLDRTPEGYITFRNAIFEKRVLLLKNDKLEEELSNLEQNQSTGKVDHPKNGCFTGDTKVKLSDGRSPTMLELVNDYESGKINYIRAYNHQTKQFEIKKIVKAWKTKSNAILVKVSLNNDTFLRCTPDHRFLLKNGSYVEAENLKFGMSLMSSSNNIEVLKVEYIKEREDVFDITVEDLHNFELFAGIFVHNSKDMSDGLCLHGDTKVYTLTGKYKTLRELYQNKLDNKLNEAVLAFNTEINCVEAVKITDVVNNGYKESLIKLILNNGRSLVCTPDHRILTESGKYIKAEDTLHINLMSFYQNQKSCIVEKIETVKGDEVFDLKLDKIHNFALECGLFVHNCGALWAASMYENEMPNIGKSLDYFFAANLPNNFESELNSFGNQLLKESVLQIENKEESEEKDAYAVTEDDDIDTIIAKVTGQIKNENKEYKKHKEDMGNFLGIEAQNQEESDLIDAAMKDYYLSLGILI